MQFRSVLGRIRRQLNACFWVILGKTAALTGNELFAITCFRNAFANRPDLPLSVYAHLSRQIGRHQEKHTSALYDSEGVALDHAAQVGAGLAAEQSGDFARADRHFSFAIALSDAYVESKFLDRQIQRIVQDDTLVITQFAVNYFPIFEIFFDHFARHRISNFLVIALDPVTRNRVEELGVAVHYLPVFNFQPGIKSILWHETVKFRRRLNQMGIHYLHTDTDAFWLKNVYRLMKVQNGDIVSSIGFGVPREAVDAWGFSMCLGLYLMRSTQATRGMYPEYIRRTKENAHDQNGLNRLLLDRGVAWQQDPDGGHSGPCQSLGLSLRVMPEKIASRNSADLNGDPAVFHPLLEAPDMKSKMEQLAGYGFNA